MCPVGPGSFQDAGGRSYSLFSALTTLMSTSSKPGKSPPRSKPSLRRPRGEAYEISDRIDIDRLLAYKPIISSDVKPDPPHLNTKGQAPSGRNVGKLEGLMKMPQDVFCEVLYESHVLYTTNLS